MCGNPPPRRKPGQGATHDIVPSLTASGRGVERNGESRGQDPVVVHGFGGGNTSGPIDAAACLTAKGQRIDFEIETFVVSPRGENDNTPLAFDCKTSGRNGFAVGEVAPTLRAMNSLHSHQNAGGQVAVVNRGEVRRLTPIECERVQNFPDNYTLIPMKRRRPISFDEARYYWRQAEPGIKCWCENGKWYTNAAPDGPRYKALGNSMATNVMRWIGKRIEMVEQIINERIAA
jgi:DNA (cytosine-5)-methyltransferase 1